METIYKSLEHAPSLLAMVALVVIFTRVLEKMLVSHGKRTDEFIETVKNINRESNDERRASREVIKENTKAAAENTVAMDEMTHYMRELVRK